MPEKSLTKEQIQSRNILYSILALTIFLSVFVDFYYLIDTKYRPFINFFMIGINGIVFYIGYKKQLINKASLIFTILTVTIIVAITLLKR
jgi:uncharacterized membrane protein